MKRKFSVYWLLLVLFAYHSGLYAQTIQIKTSELFEAFFLLNHIGNDSDPNPEVQFWKKHRSEDARKAVFLWEGRGKDLATLLYPMREKTLATFVEELKNPTAIQARLMAVHSPETPEFLYFQKYHSSLLTYLETLQNAQFRDFWLGQYGTSLQETLQKIRTHFSEFDRDAFSKGFRWFSGTELPTRSELNLYVIALSNNEKLILTEGDTLFSANLFSELPSAWAHLLFQKIPIGSENLEQVKLLSQKKYYRKISQRIHIAQPLSEEYRLAASLYLALQSKILSVREAMFQLKMAYPHSEDPFDTGSPLAAIIFKRLMETPLDSYPNYDEFLTDLWKSQTIPVNYLQRNAQEIWEEVAGNAGIFLQEEQNTFKIGMVLTGYFAEMTGLQKGDLLLNIDEISLENKTLSEVLSLLAGYHGEEKTLTLKRAEEVLVQKIYLD
ncbi:MAG: hypothetical protein AABZ60_10535 [Planctomycetota bacterium]